MGRVRERVGPFLARVAELARDQRVRDAALIGYTFRIDPVGVVMAETDPLARAIRLAAFDVVQTELANNAPKS